MAHIKASLPDNMDPLKFAYHSNRFTEDAISIAIHWLEFSIQHIIFPLNLSPSSGLCVSKSPSATESWTSCRAGHKLWGLATTPPPVLEKRVPKGFCGCLHRRFLFCFQIEPFCVPCRTLSEKGITWNPKGFYLEPKGVLQRILL